MCTNISPFSFKFFLRKKLTMVAHTRRLGRSPRRSRDPRSPPKTPPSTMTSNLPADIAPTVTQEEESLSQAGSPPETPEASVDNGSSVVQQLVWMMHQNNLPENTKKAYKNKALEWTGYCNHVWGSTPYSNRYLVDADKSHRFLTYQAFRPQRARGGRRSGNSDVSLLKVANDALNGHCSNVFSDGSKRRIRYWRLQ